MSLDKFKKFQKEKIKEVVASKNIWGYTRVSSKLQLTNNSLEEQQSDITNFANKGAYVLEKMLGGTCESASGDFTRKEFNKLLDEVKSAKKKPFAIAIKFISRFSRTGGSAISIVNELVEKMGVHIIETSTGLCTDNEYSKLEIFNKLIDARKENMDRLEKTLPGMKALLGGGDWLGKAPRGYTMRGKKVTDYTLLQETQSITINEEGDILKKAWEWKLMGERDYIIRRKLEDLGLLISKQGISSMWRNPFYCGILVNSLLDEPRDGNWKGMVSQEDFWKVEKMLVSNKKNEDKKEYSKTKISDSRPLTGFLKCECGCSLTSYVIEKKGLHYYKCQKCKDSSFNAYTTKKSKKEGLNNSFEDLLSKYTLNSQFIEPFKLQLNKLFDTMNTDATIEMKFLTKKKIEVENKIENLNDRYFNNKNFGDVAYNKYVLQFDAELKTVSDKIESTSNKLSNHKKHVEKVVEKAKNISDCWGRGDVENKIRIQNLVFPQGLSIRAKNREYLTKKVNGVFDLISVFVGVEEGSKNEKTHQNVDGSFLVAGTGLEPVTFGL